MKLFIALKLLEINQKLDQLIESRGEIMLNLEALNTAVARIVTEVGETFTTVNTVLAELRAQIPDPSTQAVIDNLTANINAKAQDLDDFQAQLSAPEPTPEPTPE